MIGTTTFNTGALERGAFARVEAIRPVEASQPRPVTIRSADRYEPRAEANTPDFALPFAAPTPAYATYLERQNVAASEADRQARAGLAHLGACQARPMANDRATGVGADLKSASELARMRHAAPRVGGARLQTVGEVAHAAYKLAARPDPRPRTGRLIDQIM